LPSGEEGDPVWRNCFFLQVQAFHVQSIFVILSWYIHSGYAKLFILLIRFLLVTTGWDKKGGRYTFPHSLFQVFYLERMTAFLCIIIYKRCWQ
jgi:hypothetical protein